MGEWNSTQKSYQDYVYSFYSDCGLPANSIFGLMGNISQECSWNPLEVEAGTGIGFGIFQWSFERRTQLEAYGTDLYHQCNFGWSEMSGTNLSTTGAQLQWGNQQGYTWTAFSGGTYSPSEAAAAFCWCFERPNVNQANLSYRQSEAEYFATQYAGVMPTPPPIPMPSTAKSKIIYIYGQEDSLFGRRADFYGDLTVIITTGNRSLVKDSVGNVHEVNKKYMNVN